MNENGTNMYMPVAPAYGGNGFFGGDMGSGWWVILLVLLMGGGLWGGGGYGGGANNIYPWMNQADITTSGFQNQMLQSGISGLQSAITSGFGDVQTALCGGFAGVNAGIANGFAQAEIANNARQIADMQQTFANQMATMQGFNGLQGQLAQCCCDNRLATCQTQNIVQTESAATRSAIQAGVQSVLDKLCQDDIDRKNEKILELQNSLNMANLNASQTAQTATILAALTTTTPAAAAA